MNFAEQLALAGFTALLVAWISCLAWERAQKRRRVDRRIENGFEAIRRDPAQRRKAYASFHVKDKLYEEHRRN